MNDPVLHVQMLGGFSLQLDARTVPPISSRTAASLLAFVILRRERAQTRDLLAGRFWSDLSEDKARRRLSNALWMIRNAGREAGLDDLLRTTSTTIGFNPAVPVEVDVEKFEQRLDSFERSYRTDRRSVGIPELTEIVDSYQGDLLAGHYDEWIDDQRKKTRERYLAALSVLVQMNIGEADYESALRHARALVAAEPLSEEWHRSVMRLYALNSQPSAAERQYGQCRDILSSELGVEPSPETTELHERLRTELAAPLAVFASATDEPLPFVGRATERSALLSRANELVSGKGGVILIEGQPGIGKSRLVEEVSKGAEWRGVPVLIGYHSPTSALNPYEGLKEALGPSTRGVRGERLVSNVAPIWIRQASTVLDDLPMIDPGVRQPLRPEEEPWRTTEALVQVILALGRPKPLMIVLEDVHWCDEDTMAVLVQLGDRLIDSGILICLSYQRHEAQRRATIWRGLNELEAKPGSSRHVLPPLEDDEVRQLVTAELGPGRMSGQTLTQLVTTTAGNPYVIVELLRSPIEVFDIDAFTSSEASSAASGEGELMPRLLDILSQRIDSASHEVQAVLDVISAMSGPASTKVVAGVMGLELGSAASALAEAVELTFLVETPRGCEFAQEQTRRTVYDRLGAEARRQLHGAIVDSLVREQRAGVGQLAHHAWLAEQWPRAYQYHSLAAESALKVHAYHTTAEHFGKADLAAQSAHIADDDRIDDLFAYERVLDILGRRPEQQALLDRLSGLSNIDPVSALLVRHRQGWLLAHTDRGAEAARLAADGVEPARQAGLGVGELLTIVGCARAWSGDMHGAIEPLREAVYELSAEGSSGVMALLMLGWTYAELQQFEAAHEHLENAYDMAKAENDARSQVEALGHLAGLHLAQRHDMKAEHAFLEALELARAIGYRHGEGLNLVNLAACQVMVGRGGRAVGLFREAGEVFASLGNGRGQAFVKVNAAELAHWILGDDVAARTQADQAAIYFRTIGDRRREAACLVTLASIDRRQGRRRLARRRLQEALIKAKSTDDPAIEADGLVNLALVELELGHAQAALDRVDSAVVICREAFLDSMTPVLLAIEARARMGLGQIGTAVELVARAIALNRPGATLAHLVAWWCSEVLAQAGDEAAAADQVASAHQLLSRNLDDLPEPVVRVAWVEVAEHKAISEARELYFVNQIECQLPRLDAPTGRALAVGDFVDVIWTTSRPDDWSASVPAARRQLRVLRLTAQAVDQGAGARVSDLAQALGVSERTIKRDLAQLRSEGHQPLTRRTSEEKSLDNEQ